MALPKNPDRPNKNIYAEGEDPLAREGGPASPATHSGLTSNEVQPPVSSLRRPVVLPKQKG